MDILSLIIGVLAGGIITFIVTYYFFKKSPSKQDIKKIDQKLDKIKESKKYEKFLLKVKDAINKKQIEIEKVLSKLSTPLYAILIRKYNEDKTHKIEKFLRSSESKFKIIGPGLYILPPENCPEINASFDVKKWLNEEILKTLNLPQNYKRLFSFISVIDLRKTAEERVIAKRGRTIFEVLGKDRQIMANLLSSKKIFGEVCEIIDNSDISWLIDKDCSNEELEKIQSNSDEILKKLGKSKLTDLFTLEKQEIEEELKKYCSNFGSVAEQIKENSLFWNNLFS
jgi:gas vesicle protein